MHNRVLSRESKGNAKAKRSECITKAIDRKKYAKSKEKAKQCESESDEIAKQCESESDEIAKQCESESDEIAKRTSVVHALEGNVRGFLHRQSVHVRAQAHTGPLAVAWQGKGKVSVLFHKVIATDI
jgi:hypothetical protein